MNKTILKILVGFIALSLAICAAFFSIVGLSKLFAGAAVAVIVMSSTLEASKLVIASFLHQHWKTVNKNLKAYLLIAISIITLITSIGIYGFLSGAYHTTKSKFDLTRTRVDSLEGKKLYYASVVSNLKTQLENKNSRLNNLSVIRNYQEQRATQIVYVRRTTGINSTERSAKRTDKTIGSLGIAIDSINKKINAYTDSITKVTVSVTQLNLKNEISSELGSLSYISKILNVPMDNVVNFLILLFIIVFDPLAICLVLVFNFLSHETIELNNIQHGNETNSATEHSAATEPLVFSSETPEISTITDETYTNYIIQESNSTDDLNSVQTPEVLNTKQQERSARLQRSINGAMTARGPTFNDDVKFY
jgi:hypothetical protein